MKVDMNHFFPLIKTPNADTGVPKGIVKIDQTREFFYDILSIFVGY